MTQLLDLSNESMPKCVDQHLPLPVCNIFIPSLYDMQQTFEKKATQHIRVIVTLNDDDDDDANPFVAFKRS